MGETMGSTRLTGSIVALIGGLGLVIGAWLTWASVFADAQAFAAALGIDPELAAGLPDRSQSISGLQFDFDGRWALVMGTLIICLGAILLVWKVAPKEIAVGILVAGIVGSGFALYDIARIVKDKQDAIQDAIREEYPQVDALDIDVSGVAQAIDVSLGVGIWMCAIGGLVAIAGGAVVLGGRDEVKEAASPEMETVSAGQPARSDRAETNADLGSFPRQVPAPPSQAPPREVEDVPPDAPDRA